MKRNPALADEAGKVEYIQDLRHIAIDKITGAHIAVEIMNKRVNSPAEQLDNEERMLWLFEDATYAFQKYIHEKLKVYETMLLENKGAL